MKKLYAAFLALLTFLLITEQLPAQAFAADTAEYISEVKLGVGSNAEEAEKALEGYTILKVKGKNADLNSGKGSEGGTVYLGYKTTNDRSDAVSDLALMNAGDSYDYDENSVTVFNEKGEKLGVTNNSVYYKAVEGGEFNAFSGGSDGTRLDLYAAKSEALEPISANSIIAVAGKKDVPSGYTTGIHLFGSDEAYAFGSESDSADSEDVITVYYRTDSGSDAAVAGSVFTTGNIAFAAALGILFGAGIAAFAVKTKKQKPST